MRHPYYHIVKNRNKYWEVVHPRQIRKSDRIILTITKERWYDFCAWCGRERLPFYVYPDEKDFLAKFEEFCSQEDDKEWLLR